MQIPPGGRTAEHLYLAVGVSLGDLEPKQFQGQEGAWLSVAEARAVARRGDCRVCQESQNKGGHRNAQVDIMRQQPPKYLGLQAL